MGRMVTSRLPLRSNCGPIFWLARATSALTICFYGTLHQSACISILWRKHTLSYTHHMLPHGRVKAFQTPDNAWNYSSNQIQISRYLSIFCLTGIFRKLCPKLFCRNNQHWMKELLCRKPLGISSSIPWWTIHMYLAREQQTDCKGRLCHRFHCVQLSGIGSLRMLWSFLPQLLKNRALQWVLLPSISLLWSSQDFPWLFLLLYQFMELSLNQFLAFPSPQQADCHQHSWLHPHLTS